MLAAARGCTEAAASGEAIDRLPEPGAALAEQLAAGGLLAPKRQDPDTAAGGEMREVEAEVDAWRDSHPEPLTLAEAVIAGREGR